MIYRKPTLNPEQRAELVEKVKETLTSSNGAGNDLDYAGAAWGDAGQFEVHGNLDLAHLVEEIVEKWEEIR